MIFQKITFEKHLKIKKLKKLLTNRENCIYNILCHGDTKDDTKETFGVWLSLARAPGLGPGGRRFESCHPDHYAGVVQW